MRASASVEVGGAAASVTAAGGIGVKGNGVGMAEAGAAVGADGSGVTVGAGLVGVGVFVDGMRVSVRVGDGGICVSVAGVDKCGRGVMGVRVLVGLFVFVGWRASVGLGVYVGVGLGVSVGRRVRMGLIEGVAGVAFGKLVGAALISAAPRDAPPGLSGESGAVCAATGMPDASKSKMSADSRQIMPGTQALAINFEMGSEDPFMISSFG